MSEQRATSQPYVFLSYTTPDRERVLALADTLENAGVRIWVDRRQLVGGMSWDAAIVRAIKDCAAFMILCTPAAVTSPNVLQELRLAWEEQRPTLPLLLERTTFSDEMRYIVAGRQWVELLDWPEQAWLPNLLQALAGLGVPAAAGAPPSAVPHEPAPAPARTDTTVGNLPVALTSFVGRDRELSDLSQLLQSGRLLTLTGPGGTGKTRLAVVAARQIQGRFADGVWFVDLSSVEDPAHVPAALALVLGVREGNGESLRAELTAFLRDKQALLVLDNFEQVVDGAGFAQELLTAAAGLSLLVTSRIALRLTGEREYAVTPLPLPAADTSLADIEVAPAIALFVQRALDVRPDFVLTADTAAAVVAICTRLDGLPLAIELAAVRVRILTPTVLEERLRDALKLLTGGGRGLPVRQQTLRGTIQWSYDLLTPAEQRLLLLLAIFSGGWTLDAAETICVDDDGALDVLVGLESLSSQSLVRQTVGADGQARFGMLATIREFSAGKLLQSGLADAARARHADYFTALAERASAKMWSSDKLDACKALDTEHDNLRAAMQQTLTGSDTQAALRLAGALGLWFWGAPVGEGRQWLATVLTLPGAHNVTPELGRALAACNFCAYGQGDYPALHEHAAEMVRVWRTLGDRLWLARALTMFEHLGPLLGAAVLPYGEESLALARADGDSVMLTWALSIHAMALAPLRRLKDVRQLCEEALGIARRLRSAFFEGMALTVLSSGELQGGDLPAARAALEQALPPHRAAGAENNVVGGLHTLGMLSLALNQPIEAGPYLAEALAGYLRNGSRGGIARCLQGHAVLASLRDNRTRRCSSSRQAARLPPAPCPRRRVATSSNCCLIATWSRRGSPWEWSSLPWRGPRASSCRSMRRWLWPACRRRRE